MVVLNNYISKILFKDTNNSYSVLTYIDVDGIFTEQYVHSYVNEVFQQNNNLHQYIIEKNNQFFLEHIDSIHIKDYCSIIYTNHTQFDRPMDTMLNDNFNTELKWKFLFCIDKENHKSRFYFKIHHSLADGYLIIKMLTSPFQKNDFTHQFNRKTTFFNTLYYYFIGTILLLVMYIRNFFTLVFKSFNREQESTKRNTDYIVFKPLNFQDIKPFTKKKNITVNDFLYSLMIKTDDLYRQKEKIVLTVSPMNVSGTTQLNNMFPILFYTNNSCTVSTLITKVNHTFNNFKYSLFIPCLYILMNCITPYTPLNLFSNIYTTVLDHTDYVYSNVIGPSRFFFTNDIKVTDIHFLTNASKREIVYNIISCDDNINIICSFKKGVISNKRKFKQCLYKAYSTIINLE